MADHQLPGVRLRKKIHVANVEERRREPRADIRIPLRVKIPTVEAAFSSEALNISHGGAFIPLQQLPEIGAAVDVEVTLESGALLLHASGEVVRVEKLRKPRGVGVRFLEISYEAQSLIDRLVSDERIFGKYRIEALVGRGGMAEVYRAQVLDGEHAGRAAAIKRILPSLEDRGMFVELFEKEAAVAKLFAHPNVVEVLEADRVGDTLYIAMDYVDGCNLSLILGECRRRSIKIPIDFACYVCRVVAGALEYVHELRGEDGQPLGLVHRDVAPGNVFISRIGEIKLGDFGIVFVKSAGEGAARAGKTPYMAPEIVTVGHSTPSSDIFALGAILYEMVTGRIAFDGISRNEVRRRIVTRALPRPKALRPEISDDLDELIMRALSPRPADGTGMAWRQRFKEVFGSKAEPRFATAREFAAAIDPLYDPAVGTQMAIASVVRNLLARVGQPLV